MTDWPAPPLPRPAALRLATVAGETSFARAQRPPLGVLAWTDANDADIVVLLAGPRAAETLTLAEAIRQVESLVRASSLRAGALVLVAGELASRGGILGRLLGARARVPRAIRTTALLALGLEHVGGGIDARTGEDLAWGCVTSTLAAPRA